MHVVFPYITLNCPTVQAAFFLILSRWN